jgi:hypothetical protein
VELSTPAFTALAEPGKIAAKNRDPIVPKVFSS